MKRIVISVSIILIVLLSCVGCGFFGEQEYFCNINNVKSVQIINLDAYVADEYRYDYTVIYELYEYSAFIEEVNSLEHSVNWGEPSQLDIGYTVIKIDYENGDYDLLYSNAQWFNRSGINNYGYFFFDEEQFNSLIDKTIS